MSIRERIEGKVREGLMKQGKWDEAKELRELDKDVKGNKPKR